MRLLAALCLALLPALPAHAEEAEAPMHHYAAPEMQSVKDAQGYLQSSTDKILAVKGLDDSGMEAIHEQSYTLEAALDYLRLQAKSDAQNALLDALDEAIQTVHYASENHDKSEIEAVRPQLKAAVDQTLAKF